MPEVMARWGWTENDLLEALILGRIVPSYFIKKALWPVNPLTSKQTPPAIFKCTWMYLVNFKQTDAKDGYFHNVADKSDAVATGQGLFKIDGNGYTKDHLIRLGDAMTNGVVMMDEILRFEASSVPISTVREPDPKQRWWVEGYDIVAMATKIEADAAEASWGVNQSGKRAGKYPIQRIAELVAAEVEKAEKAAKRTRTIGAKSIANHLKALDWA